MRPTTVSGRIMTGYIRPVTMARDSQTQRQKGGAGTSSTALRMNTAHVMSSSGRVVRLGTASLVSDEDGTFINIDKLDLKKYSTRPVLARVSIYLPFFYNLHESI
jgi:tetratricopeptide repeat protein 8